MNKTDFFVDYLCREDVKKLYREALEQIYCEESALTKREEREKKAEILDSLWEKAMEEYSLLNTI